MNAARMMKERSSGAKRQNASQKQMKASSK
jgi:hypothetical protein